jgi:hypothetical protein
VELLAPKIVFTGAITRRGFRSSSQYVNEALLYRNDSRRSISSIGNLGSLIDVSRSRPSFCKTRCSSATSAVFASNWLRAHIRKASPVPRLSSASTTRTGAIPIFLTRRLNESLQAGRLRQTLSHNGKSAVIRRERIGR